MSGRWMRLDNAALIFPALMLICLLGMRKTQ